MDGLDAVVKAGQTIGETKAADVAGKGQYAVIPNDARLESLEGFQGQPNRIKASRDFYDVPSLIEYVKRFRTDNTVFLADQTDGVIRAAIDYHGPAEPSHCDHSAEYSAPYSEEWTRWTALDGRKLAQVEFARFVEENVIDIVEPSGADMLEVAQSLQARKKVNFVSDQRLADGSTQFTYNEETETATAGKGKIKVPNKFAIGVPVYFDGDRYKVECLLRYRIDEGRLMMWFDMHRRAFIQQKAFAEIVQVVRDAGLAPVYLGT